MRISYQMNIAIVIGHPYLLLCYFLIPETFCSFGTYSLYDCRRTIRGPTMNFSELVAYGEVNLDKKSSSRSKGLNQKNKIVFNVIRSSAGHAKIDLLNTFQLVPK